MTTQEINFREIYDSSPDMLLSTDANTGCVLECNTTLLDTLGYTRSEVIGKPLIEMYHPHELHRVKRNLASFRQNGKILYTDFNVLKKDGDSIPVTLKFSVIKDQNGKILYSNAAWRDVSSLRKAQSQLEFEKNKRKQLYDTAPDMHLSTDAKTGCVIDCNQTLVDLLGFTREQIIGTPVINMYHINFHQLAKENLLSFQQGGDIVHEEFEVLKSDGTTLEVSLKFTPVYDDNGQLLYSNAVWRDISELKQMQRDLEREKAKSDELLLNILPESIATRLKSGESVIADSLQSTSTLFADIVGFTEIAQTVSASRLIEILNMVFSRFDDLVRTHKLEKIKTIGDAYMVASGLPNPRPGHAKVVAEFAIDLLSLMEQINQSSDLDLQVRIGIGSGPVVAGIIGKEKFSYDLWGDSVNIASRMESSGVPGRIQVDETTFNSCKKNFNFEPRGLVSIKGKGEMPTWFLLDRGTG